MLLAYRSDPKRPTPATLGFQAKSAPKKAAERRASRKLRMVPGSRSRITPAISYGRTPSSLPSAACAADQRVCPTNMRCSSLAATRILWNLNLSVTYLCNFLHLQICRFVWVPCRYAHSSAYVFRSSWSSPPRPNET